MCLLPNPDTRIFLCVCSTLRSPSLCSSWSFRSGDHKSKRTRLALRTPTRCRWKARSGIFWTMRSSTGPGWCAICWEACLPVLGCEVSRPVCSRLWGGRIFLKQILLYSQSGVGLPPPFHEPGHFVRMGYQKCRSQPHVGICWLAQWRRGSMARI
jgi:hypothetical protein